MNVCALTIGWGHPPSTPSTLCTYNTLSTPPASFPPKFLSIFNKGEKFEWKSAQWWHLSASKISQNGKNHNLFLTFLYIWPPTISLTNFLTSWPLKILAVQRMATIVALARDMFVPLPCPYLPRIMSHKVEKPTNLETKMALFERSAGEWVSDVIAF